MGRSLPFSKIIATTPLYLCYNPTHRISLYFLWHLSQSDSFTGHIAQYIQTYQIYRRYIYASKQFYAVKYSPFRHSWHPLLHPERLESLLSELLGEPVHIESVLPKEGSRLSYEASLIIMDILVKLSDGSRVNVEIKKISLRFPGERSSCYAADAIMRQYTELKSTLKKDFDYRKMRPVYLIILMKESSKPFKDVAPHYIHTEEVRYDSDARGTSLPKIKYISLDTLQRITQLPARLKKLPLKITHLPSRTKRLQN